MTPLAERTLSPLRPVVPVRSPSWPPGPGPQRGLDDDGRPIELTDSRAEALRSRARSDDPLAFVADRDLFGDLADDDRFASTYRDTLTSMRTRGVRATLDALA